MNKLSVREYQEIKDQAVCVVSFESGFRVLMIGNLNYKKAIETVMIQQRWHDRVCLVMTDNQVIEMLKMETGFSNRCSIDEARRIIREDEARQLVWQNKMRVETPQEGWDR